MSPGHPEGDAGASAPVLQPPVEGESRAREASTATSLLPEPDQGGPGRLSRLAHKPPRPPDQVVVQSLPEPAGVRRASDMLRLLIALAVLACAMLLAALDHVHVRVT